MMALAAQTMATAVAAPRGHQAPARAQDRSAPLPALTGLRFVAALLVVGVHFGQASLPAPLAALAATGAVGVSLFFVLSGFILAYSYAATDGRMRGGRRAFYRARVARVYPAYLLALLVALVAARFVAPPGVAQSGSGLRAALALASHVTLVQAWLPGVHFRWNGPGWSLSAEAFFYALFPFLLPPLRRLGGHGLVRLLLLLYAAALVAPVLYLGLHPDPVYTLPCPPWLDVVLFNPLVHLPTFVAGMALGLLFLRRRAGRARVPDRWAAVALSVVAALTPFVLVAAAGRVPAFFLRTGTLLPLFGLLIVLVAWGQGPVAALLRHRALIRLGEASYALYLLHWPLHALYAHLVGVPEPATAPSLPFFVAYLGLCIACSLLCVRLVETPARQALRPAHRLSASSPQRLAGPASRTPNACAQRG